jgi:hypothetical protein
MPQVTLEFSKEELKALILPVEEGSGGAQAGLTVLSKQEVDRLAHELGDRNAAPLGLLTKQPGRLGWDLLRFPGQRRRDPSG